MKSFGEIYQRAAMRKGGPEKVEETVATGYETADLTALPDDRYLAEMTRRIFAAGFVWKVIDQKWPGFEEAFQGFDIVKMAGLSDDNLADLAQDERIVRNPQKIRTVRDNAHFILDIDQEYGSFGKFLNGWPEDDLVGLFALLKKRGSRLGGATAQYFLRFIGKDTFILSKDVVGALVDADVIDSPRASSKRDQRAIQEAFNQWHEESGRTYTEMSRVLALSFDG